MNQHIEVYMRPNLLSDGSKTWDAAINNGESVIRVECVSEEAAYRMMNALTALLEKGDAK